MLKPLMLKAFRPLVLNAWAEWLLPRLHWLMADAMDPPIRVTGRTAHDALVGKVASRYTSGQS